MSSTAMASSPSSFRCERLVPSGVLDWDRLGHIATNASAAYRAASPFPHTVLDGVFSDELLDQAVAELPGASANWTGYDTANERKQVCSDTAAFGPTAETIAHALNSSRFTRFLETLTGIRGLIPDPHMHAAGYMKVPPGGFLGLHYDFATQRELMLDRRINVLLYLNRDWQRDWGGQLELHSNDPLTSPRHEQIKVEPLFNRLLIFNTPQALHGHRTPVACPKGRARLCLSWYYYTAPPVPDWAARSTSVKFKGRFEPARAMTNAINLVTPPILVHLAKAAARAIRARRTRRTPATSSR
jgi:Rps23 Pro-64 3,4-dihydroxylase Tpa1-like proline 4-hydroxylase